MLHTVVQVGHVTFSRRHHVRWWLSSVPALLLYEIGKAPYLSEHSGRPFSETRHWKNHTNSRLVLDPSRSQRTCRISFFSLTLLQSVCASSQVAVSSGPDRLKSCSLLDVCGGLFFSPFRFFLEALSSRLRIVSLKSMTSLIISTILQRVLQSFAIACSRVPRDIDVSIQQMLKPCSMHFVMAYMKAPLFLTKDAVSFAFFRFVGITL